MEKLDFFETRQLTSSQSNRMDVMMNCLKTYREISHQLASNQVKFVWYLFLLVEFW
jgi:hypothetical protein